MTGDKVIPSESSGSIENILSTNTSSSCNIARKWGIKFNGDTDPISFIERIDELAECYGILEEQLLTALPALFEEKALLWYRNNRQDWRTWSHFRQGFYKQYLPSRYRRYLEDQIRTRIQRPSEKVKDYIVDLQTLMRRLGTLSNSEQLERLYENLQPKYKLYIRWKDINDLTDLLDMADEYESIQESISKSKPPQLSGNRFRPPVSFQPTRKPGHQAATTNLEWQQYLEEVQNWYQKPTDLSAVDSRIFLSANILGDDYKILIDTGSAQSYIGNKIAAKLRQQGIQPGTSVRNSVKLADGRVISTQGVYEFNCSVQEVEFRHQWHHIPQLTSTAILGIDLMSKLNMQIDIGKKSVIIGGCNTQISDDEENKCDAIVPVNSTEQPNLKPFLRTESASCNSSISRWFVSKPSRKLKDTISPKQQSYPRNQVKQGSFKQKVDKLFVQEVNHPLNSSRSSHRALVGKHADRYCFNSDFRAVHRKSNRKAGSRSPGSLSPTFRPGYGQQLQSHGVQHPAVEANQLEDTHTRHLQQSEKLQKMHTLVRRQLTQANQAQRCQDNLRSRSHHLQAGPRTITQVISPVVVKLKDQHNLQVGRCHVKSLQGSPIPPSTKTKAESAPSSSQYKTFSYVYRSRCYRSRWGPFSQPPTTTASVRQSDTCSFIAPRRERGDVTKV